MDPTPEQAEAIRLFNTGDSLAIEAGAGTGKTSTLVLIAESSPGDKGQYVAFNRALVEESRAKFPFDVACNTAHSLAFREVGKNYAHRLNSSMRMRGDQIAARLGLGYADVLDFQGKPKTLFPGYLASLAQKTVTNFCQSASLGIDQRHVPHIEGLDDQDTMRLREMLVDPAKVLWADLQGLNGWVPFKHEHYLKMWQLADPRINKDYILFDEAQDANPVIAAIVAAQEKNGCQLVYVGDSQQEIYGWTGAVNALAKVNVKQRAFLTQSFRFGQAVADRANTVLEALNAQIRLTGNPAIESKLERLTQPKAILVRTNATGLTYLLQMQKDGREAFFNGSVDEILRFADGADQLQTMGRTMHPDLVNFDTWEAVRAYVDQDESGEDLKLMVRLMDNFGVSELRQALIQMPRPERAEVVISTAHRSKGQEWPTVQIGPDFPEQAKSSEADMRLLYVAITRAREILDDEAISGYNEEG
jgi:hypothetical protein